jgi:hypothetical protein
MRRLKRIVPWANLPHPLNTDIGSRISATLSILMPKEFEEQHKALGMNPISLELYLLSNNLQSHDTNLLSEASIRSRDTRAIGMFRSLGWHTMKQFAFCCVMTPLLPWVV